MLFKPNSNMGGSELGISDMVTSSIGKCNENMRSTLFNNVIVTGGNSLLKVIFKMYLIVKN